MRGQYTEAEYVRILKSHCFLHHNLEYGIPLPTACADFVFSSHFLEHLSKAHGEQLVREAGRILKSGGTIRIAIPDLGQTIAAFQAGHKVAAMDGIFAYLDLGYFARHRFMYDFDMLMIFYAAEDLWRSVNARCMKGKCPILQSLIIVQAA